MVNHQHLCPPSKSSINQVTANYRHLLQQIYNTLVQVSVAELLHYECKPIWFKLLSQDNTLTVTKVPQKEEGGNKRKETENRGRREQTQEKKVISFWN